MTTRPPAIDLGLAVVLATSVAVNAVLVLRGAEAHVDPAASERGVPRPRAVSSLRAPMGGCEASSAAPSSAATPPITPPPPEGRAEFDGEARDPAWAPRQEASLEAHLDELLAPYQGRAEVECRSRCCTLAVVEAEDAAGRWFQLDLQTSAGLLGTIEGLRFSRRVVACFDRTAAPSELPTGLARLRNRWLERLQPEFERCSRLAEVPFEVGVTLDIGRSGRSEGSQRVGELAGSDAARCVEQALVNTVEVGPQAAPRDLLFVVPLAPPGR